MNVIDRARFSLPPRRGFVQYPRFLCVSETQNYISHARDFRVGHVTRSSIRSGKKLGDISREFPGIPPITLPISALTRPFLRFREDDIREKSDKMGNKKERDIYLALHDVVPLISCNEKYRIYMFVQQFSWHNIPESCKQCNRFTRPIFFRLKEKTIS